MKNNRIWFIMIPCLLSCAVTIVMATILLLPIFRYSNEIKNFRFEKVDSGYAVTEYVGNSSTIAIPSVYKGENVVEIADYAFSDKEKFHSVSSLTLPTGLVRIGNSAFCGMTGIESISVPKTCEFIGNSAFFGCENLKNVNFAPGNVLKSVGANAFSLTSLQVSFLECDDDFLIVDKVALFAKSQNANVVLPAEIRVLSHDAGYFLSNNGELNLSVAENSDLEYVSDYAFSGCDVLCADFSNAKKLAGVGRSCFRDCEKLTSVKFSDSVEMVGFECFFGCGALENVSFGKSRVKFDSQIFDNLEAVDRLELSAWCSGIDKALGTEKFFATDDLTVCVSEGIVFDDFVDVFAHLATGLCVEEDAYISWGRLCKFDKLSSAALPVGVVNDCTNATFMCADVVRIFGDGTIGLDCSPNIETNRLVIDDVCRIEDDCFAEQKLGYIDVVEINAENLQYVGKHAFARTNWFINFDKEAFCVGKFCVSIKDLNGDGLVEIDEGVEVVCSEALVGSNVGRVVLPSTLTELSENCFMAKIGTLVFREKKGGKVLLSKIGSGAMIFGFDAVETHSTSNGTTWENRGDSLILSDICYVGENAFKKDVGYFADQLNDIVTFGSTVVVLVKGDFGGKELNFSADVRVVASNAYDVSISGKPNRLNFSDSIVMIGKNYFGNEVRYASFGTGLETVEGNGLFEFNEDYDSNLLVKSASCVKLLLLVKTNNKPDVLFAVVEECFSFYESEILGLRNYRLVVAGE